MKKEKASLEGGDQMREPRGYHGKGIFLPAGAFALGATIGSLVALLFAPASGKVT